MTDQHGENPAEPEGTGQPESSATPPPPPPPASDPAAAPATPTSAPSSGGSPMATVQEAHRFDLGIIAAGVIAWLAGFMPFYTASVSAGAIGASTSVSAYHGFFGWFAVWVALGGAAVVAASLFGVNLGAASAHTVAVGAFAVSLVCLVLALFIFPGGGCPDTNGLISCDTGHGFGYWLALILVLAGLALSVLRMRESTTAPAATA